MQRMTKRGKHGTVFAVVDGKTLPGAFLTRREYQDYIIFDKIDLRPLLERLAAYEETGMEPEEIKER